MVRRHPEAELVALCDVYAAGDRHGRLRGALLQRPGADVNEAGIDVVNVCTRTASTRPRAWPRWSTASTWVREAGMALTKADCEKAIYKALQVHRTVFGVMQNRYSPPSAWLKEVVEGGLLGEVFRCR